MRTTYKTRDAADGESKPVSIAPVDPPLQAIQCPACGVVRHSNMKILSGGKGEPYHYCQYCATTWRRCGDRLVRVR